MPQTPTDPTSAVELAEFGAVLAACFDRLADAVRAFTRELNAACAVLDAHRNDRGESDS